MLIDFLDLFINAYSNLLQFPMKFRNLMFFPFSIIIIIMIDNQETLLSKTITTTTILNQDQQHALNMAMEGKNLFITGGPGTGKTETVKHIIRTLRAQCGKTVAVTASTGTAAKIFGGCVSTIHSWSGIGAFDPTTTSSIPWWITNNKNAKKNWNNTDTLIIDEISMISVPVFELLDRIARIHRYKNSHKFFGGIQLVCSGDFCQLPPVIKKDRQTTTAISSIKKRRKTDSFEKIYKKILNQNSTTIYGGNENKQQHHKRKRRITTISKEEEKLFCFESEIWQNEFNSNDNSNGTIILLQYSFRQREDSEFLDILNNLRTGELLNKDLLKLNQKCVNYTASATNNLIPQSSNDSSPILIYNNENMTYMDPFRKEVNKKNEQLFNQIEGTTYTFNRQITYHTDWMDKKFIERRFNNVSEVVKLKIGCKVMLIKNISINDGLVNGSIGYLINIDNTNQTVDFVLEEDLDKINADTGEFSFKHTISRAEWYYYEEHGRSRTKLVTCIQMPFCIAYAITIHKCQGLTLGNVSVRLYPCFEKGQAYVALSRVPTLDSLCILGTIKKDKLLPHPKAIEYYKSLMNK